MTLMNRTRLHFEARFFMMKNNLTKYLNYFLKSYQISRKNKINKE